MTSIDDTTTTPAGDTALPAAPPTADVPPADAPAPDGQPLVDAAAAPPATAAPLSDLPAWAPAVDVPLRERWEAAPGPDLTGDRPAERPSDYTIPSLVPPGVEDEELAQVALTDAKGLANLMWAAGMPAVEGSGLLEIAVDASRQVADMDDAAFELQVRETHAQLRGMLGEQEFERCTGALDKMIERLDGQSGGKLREYLDEHAHVLVQPLVLHRLLMHAGRLEQRKR